MDRFIIVAPIILIMRTITIVFPSGGSRDFEVIETPVPHVLVDTKPKFHGWSYYNFQDAGKRECTHERWPLNPYAGCENACFICYARKLGTYARTYDGCKVMTVYKDYPALIAARLSKLHAACCAYLCTATDAFQAINTRYRHAEQLIKLFTSLNVPIEFITKRGNLVSNDVFRDIASQEHSFVQFTILSPENRKIKDIAPVASFYEEQLDAIRRARANGVKHVVARFDPIIPYYTDDRTDIEFMFRDAADAGATHVVTSCLDIPGSIKAGILAKMKAIFLLSGGEKMYEDFVSLYTNDQNVGRDLNATVAYRRSLFGDMNRLSKEVGVTFSMCMEFEVVHAKDGTIRYKGFNDEFATSKACEGIDTPIYYRENLGDKFKPLSDRIPGCDGNCLASAKGKDWSCKGACNCEPFAKATPLEEKHYKQMWEMINGSEP